MASGDPKIGPRRVGRMFVGLSERRPSAAALLSSKRDAISSRVLRSRSASLFVFECAEGIAPEGPENRRDCRQEAGDAQDCCRGRVHARIARGQAEYDVRQHAARKRRDREPDGDTGTETITAGRV